MKSHSDSNQLNQAQLINDDDNGVQPTAKPTSYPSAMVPTFAMFSGLSALMLFQADLLNEFESHWSSINKTMPDSEKMLFEHGMSAIFFGALCFRIGHNIILSFLSPKQRCILCLFLMFLSMLIIIFSGFIFESKYTFYIIISNFLGGMSIGSFEPNYLSIITPFGEKTKVYLMYGIPLGYNSLSIIGFLLLNFFNLVWIYIVVSILNLIGIFVLIRLMRLAPIYRKKNNIDDNNGATKEEVRPIAKQIQMTQLSNISDDDIDNGENINFNGSDCENDENCVIGMRHRLNEFKLEIQHWREWFIKLIPYKMYQMFSLICFTTFPTIAV